MNDPQWKIAIQAILDCVECNLEEPLPLLQLSQKAGYSPTYCSMLFSRYMGISIKSYIARRRLCGAALQLRDTDTRVQDIALQHGFSTQQALTRAFVRAYGCSPAAYRKKPFPIKMYTEKHALFPHDIETEGETIMSDAILTNPVVQIEYIPAHSYLAIREPKVDAYFPFFDYHDCDEVTGLVESMGNVAHPIIGCHTAGWYYKPDGNRGYSYGVGVDAGYGGPIPEGFQRFDIPAGYYLSFSHPPFDFMKDCEKVIPMVDALAFSYNPAEKGFAWNSDVNQSYQISVPETLGYKILRPVSKL